MGCWRGELGKQARRPWTLCGDYTTIQNCLRSLTFASTAFLTLAFELIVGWLMALATIHDRRGDRWIV